MVEVEVEVRKCGCDSAAEGGGEAMGGEEVEDGVFRTSGVLDDREDTGDRTTEVGCVEGHCYVDYIVVAFFPISERRRFLKLW